MHGFSGRHQRSMKKIQKIRLTHAETIMIIIIIILIINNSHCNVAETILLSLLLPPLQLPSDEIRSDTPF